jgi:hypothetical protein
MTSSPNSDVRPFASFFCIPGGSAGRTNWFRMVLRDDLPHLLKPPSSGPVLSDGIRTRASYQ